MAPTAELLARKARVFAAQIQHLLNATICDGVRIATVVSLPELVLVGHGLDKPALVTERFPVLIGRGKPKCWLDVSYRLCLDDEGQYLTVVSSYFGVYASIEDPSCLCHFDYERNKAGYPEAHLQVPGESGALATMSGRADKRALERLHFPVGGRRYRPILEDVIEFLIAEGFTKPRANWAEVLEQQRNEYYRIQLQAAIRRDPETAQRTLADFNPPAVPAQARRPKANTKPVPGASRPRRRRG